LSETMMKLVSSQMRALAWSALLGFAITVFGAGVWATLATVAQDATAALASHRVLPAEG
jgi:hypothetical protein